MYASEHETWNWRLNRLKIVAALGLALALPLFVMLRKWMASCTVVV